VDRRYRVGDLVTSTSNLTQSGSSQATPGQKVFPLGFSAGALALAGNYNVGSQLVRCLDEAVVADDGDDDRHGRCSSETFDMYGDVFDDDLEAVATALDHAQSRRKLWAKCGHGRARHPIRTLSTVS
jgi:hypothetical protein